MSKPTREMLEALRRELDDRAGFFGEGEFPMDATVRALLNDYRVRGAALRALSVVLDEEGLPQTAACARQVLEGAGDEPAAAEVSHDADV